MNSGPRSDSEPEDWFEWTKGGPDQKKSPHRTTPTRPPHTSPNNDTPPGKSGGSRTPTMDASLSEIGRDRHSESKLSHLPVVPNGSMDPTSYANWDVAQDLEYTIGKVLSHEMLEDLMKYRGAFEKFREFVASQPESNPILVDLYRDIQVFSELSARLRSASKAIEQVYFLKDSPSRIALPIHIRGGLLDTLRRTSIVGEGIAAPQKELLSTLFESDFVTYIQHRLVEQAVARLGSTRLNPSRIGSAERDGLADCYCLSNPRLHDQPITLASEGFAELTGYDLTSIIGRNCRFLQGPGTSPESTRRMRTALSNGNGITTLLLNYRRSGEPFFNLLCMLPLKNSKGHVKFFLGGQIDVTGSIQEIINQALTDDGASSVQFGSQSFTAVVQAHQDGSSTPKRRFAPPSNGLSSPNFLEVRQDTNRSSGRSESRTRSLLPAFTKKATTKAFKKGSELGLSAEEHAAITSKNVSSPFKTKIAEFEATYSRVMLVDPNHEILFVTPELASFCGISSTHAKDVVGSNFLKLLYGGSREDTERVRRNVRSSIEQGHAYAVLLGLKMQEKSRSFTKASDSDEPVRCILHLTPLLNHQNAVAAFVAVFGAV